MLFLWSEFDGINNIRAIRNFSHRINSEPLHGLYVIEHINWKMGIGPANASDRCPPQKFYILHQSFAANVPGLSRLYVLRRERPSQIWPHKPAFDLLEYFLHQHTHNLGCQRTFPCSLIIYLCLHLQPVMLQHRASVLINRYLKQILILYCEARRDDMGRDYWS